MHKYCNLYFSFLSSLVFFIFHENVPYFQVTQKVVVFGFMWSTFSLTHFMLFFCFVHILSWESCLKWMRESVPSQPYFRSQTLKFLFPSRNPVTQSRTSLYSVCKDCFAKCSVFYLLLWVFNRFEKIKLKESIFFIKNYLYQTIENETHERWGHLLD